MRYILLFCILFVSILLSAKPHNMNELFLKTQQLNRFNDNNNFKSRKISIENFHSAQLFLRQNRSLKINTTVFRPIMVTKNGHDKVNYPTEFVLYTYDNFGNPLTEITQQIQKGSRTNVRRITNTYDDKQNNVISNYEKWNDTGWVLMYQYSSMYDNAGNIISDLQQKWENNNWKNLLRYTYTYNNPGIWLTELDEIWDTTTNTWTPDSRYTAARDENGKLLKDVSEIWEKGNWVNDFQTLYTYDNNGNSILEIDQVWENGAWIDFLRYSTVYNNDGFWLTELYEQFDDSTSSWKPTYRYSATYDISNNLLEDLREIRTGESWKNLNKNSYNYDVNGNAVHGENYVWTNDDWSLDWGNLNLLYDNHNKSVLCNALVADIEYTSFFVTAIDDERNAPSSFSLSQNYPNPFNPSTKIRYSVPEESFIKIKIYDLLGNEIAFLVNDRKSKGDYEVEFNASNLSSGVYYYQLTAGEFIKTKKMLVLK